MGWNSDATICKVARENLSFTSMAAPYSVKNLVALLRPSGHRENPDAAMPYTHGESSQRVIHASE
jgi:hypothetical protein